MDVIEFLSKLQSVDASNDLEVEALAQRALEHALRNVRAGVASWSTTVDAPHAGAAAVLGALGELPIGPLAELPRQRLPEDEVWLLAASVEAEVLLRQKLAARLAGALDDRRQVPLVPPTRPVEQLPPPRRVCDEAYLYSRRLLHLEPLERYTLNADAFLQLDEPARDAEIAGFRQSAVWTDWAADVA